MDGGMSAVMSWLASSPGSLPGGKDAARAGPAALSLSAILSPEATRLGTAGSVLFCPGVAGTHRPRGASEQSLGAIPCTQLFWSRRGSLKASLTYGGSRQT